jgi:hypothetical protein
MMSPDEEMVASLHIAARFHFSGGESTFECGHDDSSVAVALIPLYFY